MRYTHTNLDSKRSAVAKLEGNGDNLVTPCTKLQQQGSKASPKFPLKAVPACRPAVVGFESSASDLQGS
jgi:hypothetical protein